MQTAARLQTMSVKMRNNSSFRPSGYAALLGAGISLFIFILCLFVFIIFIQSCVSFDPSSVCLRFPGQPWRKTSWGAQCAEGSRRALHPPRVYRGRPDNEIRLQLPPSRRSSRTYLSCTDAPRPRGGVLNRAALHRPTGALIWHPKMVEGANLAYSLLLFFKQCYVVGSTPLLPACRFGAGPCGTCPPVIMSCDERQIVRYW